jgi:hypothetical protein
MLQVIETCVTVAVVTKFSIGKAITVSEKERKIKNRKYV